MDEEIKTTRIWVWSGVWSHWDCSSCWTLPREQSVASLTGIPDRFSLRVYPPAIELADLEGVHLHSEGVFSRLGGTQRKPVGSRSGSTRASTTSNWRRMGQQRGPSEARRGAHGGDDHGGLGLGEELASGSDSASSFGRSRCDRFYSSVYTGIQIS